MPDEAIHPEKTNGGITMQHNLERIALPEKPGCGPVVGVPVPVDCVRQLIRMRIAKTRRPVLAYTARHESS